MFFIITTLFPSSLPHLLPPSFIHSLPHYLPLSLPPSLPPSLTPSLSPSLPPSLTPSLPHSLTPSLAPSLPPSLPCSPHIQPIHKGHQLLDGSHSWFMCSHTRPMYCNVCRVALHGVAWHGMSCEVCKIKSHRRCVFGVSERCKWTTRASMEEANAKIGYDVSLFLL